MSCYLYIIFSKTLNKFYVGHTSNLQERIRKHYTNHKGFTGSKADWKVVFLEQYNSKKDAYKREREIKKWKSRKMIERLIRNGSEHPD